MIDVLKHSSYLNGLVMNDDEACGCGYDHSQDWSVFGMKIESPSLFELDLSRRSHRWREVNKIMRSFFKAFADEVTRAEEAILQAADLGELQDVRLAEKFWEDELDIAGYWMLDTGYGKQLEPELIDRIDEIFRIWIENLIGSGTLPDRINELPAYQFHTLNAFAVGLQKT